jgi:hypothetical protein
MPKFETVGDDLMSDFTCNLCQAPAGMMVQWEACIFRCSKCGAPGPATMMEFIVGDLRSRYQAVILSRESEELEVIAEGIGTEIVPQVLAATADGKFVWMMPL